LSLLGVLRATQDLCGGEILTGSPNVFINGFPVVRVGDLVGAWDHQGEGVMATGSSYFFVNGLPVCRVGDTSTNGGVGTEGDKPFNVFTG
jgi:uncharacterized Zn-binding protein involved in type VI secretion